MGLINMMQIMDGVISYLNASIFEVEADKMVFKLKYGDIPGIRHHERNIHIHEEMAPLHRLRREQRLRDTDYRRLTLVYRDGILFDNASVIMNMYWQTLKRLDGRVFILSHILVKHRIEIPSFLYDGILFTRPSNGLIEYGMDSETEYTIGCPRPDPWADVK